MASDIPPSVLGAELPPGVTKRTVAVDCEHVEKCYIAESGSSSSSTPTSRLESEVTTTIRLR